MAGKINKKIYLIIIAAALLMGGLIWLAFFWQFGKIKTLADDIQKEQLDSLVREGRRQKVLDLEKELGDVESRNQEMEAMLVDKENAVPFLQMLENIAAETGNTIAINVADLSKLKLQTAPQKTAQVSDAESKEDLIKESKTQKQKATKEQKPDFSNQLGFSLEVTGEYRNLVDFFTKMENLPYFVQVYSFRMAPIAKGQASQSIGSGVNQVSSQASASANTEEENKKVKTTFIIGVYTNGATK